MVQLAQGWELDVERGPDWLFVRPRNVGTTLGDHPPLAEQVWALLEQSFSRRLVLELELVQHLHSYLIGQLVVLQKKICSSGGIMRVSGLSPRNEEALRLCRLDTRIPRFASREDAVMGAHPLQPR